MTYVPIWGVFIWQWQLCGVGGQEMGTKLEWVCRRRGASSSREKGRGGARSLHMIDPTKSGQVTPVPWRSQLCKGF